MQIGAPLEGQKGQQTRQQGRGSPLSFLGPQTTILTTEIPQYFSGEEAQTRWSRSSLKMHKNEAKQGLRGVKQPQTPKWS